MTCGYVYVDDSEDDELFHAYCPRHAWAGEPATNKQVAFLRLRAHRQGENQ